MRHKGRKELPQFPEGKKFYTNVEDVINWYKEIYNSNLKCRRHDRNECECIEIALVINKCSSHARSLSHRTVGDMSTLND